MNVAILGASNNPSRYAYLAFKKLLAAGHQPFPVSPKLKELEGVKVVASLNDISEPIDTLTMYVGPEKSAEMESEILSLKARRVIFNPGSENPELATALREGGTEVENACTLVMLASGQF